ncbi:MFS transporter [Rhizobium sullae]|uniref:MFS transporter n=1 Tax=Rhizobium sullae TaxID=50338 RepID=UPI00104DC222|nr:MFS transporter [Rhizobium sullae]
MAASDAQVEKRERTVAGASDVDGPLDMAKPGGLMILVWILCGLVFFLDGYDLTVITFIAPELVKEFGFDKSALGPVFVSSLVGFALAGPLLGLVGDRYGRKLTIVGSCLAFGLGTLAMLWATTISQMILCRFVIGVGLGGAMPTAAAMVAEFAPKKSRNRILALAASCVPLGAMAPGVMTAVLVPTYGWHILAIIGGVGPIILAAVLLLTMPESVKYLANNPKKHGELKSLLKRLDASPDWVPRLENQLTEKSDGRSVGRLFDGGKGPMTLMLWLAFFSTGMALFLIISWLPLVLQSLNYSIQEAGKFSAIFAGAGILGGIVIALLVSRVGVLLLPILFVIAIPFLLAFSWYDLPQAGIVLCVLIPGMSVGALQVGCSTIAGLFYPTRVRAAGIGWGLGAGRLGSIVGPMIGSAILTLELPAKDMIAFAAIPMAIGTIGSIFLVVLCKQRFGSLHVNESSDPQATIVPTAELTAVK